MHVFDVEPDGQLILVLQVTDAALGLDVELLVGGEYVDVVECQTILVSHHRSGHRERHREVPQHRGKSLGYVFQLGVYGDGS